MVRLVFSSCCCTRFFFFETNRFTDIVWPRVSLENDMEAYYDTVLSFQKSLIA